MTVEEFLRRFVRVRKCGGCGEILDYSRSDEAFCPECRLEWNASLTYGCARCFKPAVECTCMPAALSKSGALCLRKLFFYESENSSQAHMRLIYRLKRQKSRRMIYFAADQLYPFVADELNSLELEDNKQNFVMSWCPRGMRSRTEYGFDQSELVARRLSERLGVECAPVFRQRLGGKEQKELDRAQRMKNAKAHIVMKNEACDRVKGKILILYDDMVTTGASMSACVKLALKAGAAGVVCCSLACTKKL